MEGPNENLVMSIDQPMTTHGVCVIILCHGHKHALQWFSIVSGGCYIFVS